MVSRNDNFDGSQRQYCFDFGAGHVVGWSGDQYAGAQCSDNLDSQSDRPVRPDFRSSRHDLKQHESEVGTDQQMPVVGTFQDLIGRIENDKSLRPRKQRDLLSSVRCFTAKLGIGQHEPATFPRMRERLKRNTPANLGCSKRRWANILSDVKFVLNRYGARRDNGRLSDLLPEWRQLRDGIKKRTLKLGLSRFKHWCSSQGITPDQVTTQR